jgi:hypothetical protein
VDEIQMKFEKKSQPANITISRVVVERPTDGSSFLHSSLTLSLSLPLFPSFFSCPKFSKTYKFTPKHPATLPPLRRQKKGGKKNAKKSKQQLKNDAVTIRKFDPLAKATWKEGVRLCKIGVW